MGREKERERERGGGGEKSERWGEDKAERERSQPTRHTDKQIDRQTDSKEKGTNRVRSTRRQSEIEI